MENRTGSVIEIDLWKLAMACLRKAWAIILAAAIFGSANYFYTVNTVAPVYQSSVKLFVNSSTVNVGNMAFATMNVSESMELVKLYDVILKTKDTLDQIIEEAELDMTYGQLRGMLSTASVNNTSVFQITVTSTDRYNAQLIASTVAEVLPDVISGIVEKADARVVEHAILPVGRSGPNYSTSAVTGAAAGAALVIALIVIQQLMDTKIRSEEDLIDVIDEIPVLTHIPNFYDTTKKRKDLYSKNYYRSYENGGKV